MDSSDSPNIMYEEVTEEERKLAERMRSLCTTWGSEQESTLSKSTPILLELGRLYTKYAKERSGMLQKLTFVKAAALICGARMRFQKISREKEMQEAQLCFRHMAAILLSACNADICDKDLLVISDKTSAYLQETRQKEKRFIEERMKILNDGISESEMRENRVRKIESLKQLLQNNAAHYKQMMRKISEECIATLGKPPCKFALVGLGSLAREEVTLYSDFEHVILLEDGLDDSQSGTIREYFRWYSVLFHVIIIGLGETFIPTVGVKSLNDLYSDDKTTDWFFDLYTPGGVSFDGRFPHSCKTPLGKQEPSTNRKHVVELIQPVSKMLNFLSKDEDLKNGYHLRDVLVRTCFVDGDGEIYETFHQKSCSLLLAESRDLIVAQEADLFVKNMDYALKHVSGGKRTGLPDMQTFYNFKQYFYRPISVLIACFCRIYSRFTGSSFDFFSWFREVFPSIDLHDLEYALVVACEVRLKLYSALEHQRQTTEPTYLRNFIGAKCITTSYRTLLAAGIVFRRVIKSEIGFDKFSEYLDLIRHVSVKLDVDAGLLKLLGFGDLPDRLLTGMEAVSAYLEAGLKDPSKKEMYFQNIEKILEESGHAAKRSQEYCRIMTVICFHSSRYHEGFELAERWTKTYLNDKSTPAGKLRYMQLQHMKSVFLMKCLQPRQVLEYARREIETNHDPTTQIFFRIAIFSAQILLGDVRDARKSLQDSSKICSLRQTANAMVPEVHIAAAKSIFDLQMKNDWPEDAYLMFDLLQMLRNTVKQDKSFSSASTHSLISNTVNTGELATKWAEMRFVGENTPDDFVLGKILILLLRKRGILKFPEISPYFSKASQEVLKNPNIFCGLNHNIMVYCKYITDMPNFQVGEDMMSVFQTFPEHFKHPFFLGTFRCLVIHVAKISVDLKYHTEAVPIILIRPGRDEMTKLYNLAVDHFTHLNFKQSASFLWKIINCKRGRSVLRNESCRFLTHMTIPSPLVNLLHFLKRQRSAFVDRHSFAETNEKRILYNKAVTDYANFRFAPSAASFWNVILSSNVGSMLRQRAIQMLMFVILDVWKCDGYPMLIRDRYVINQWTKSPNSNHVKYEYENLYPALLMSAEDTLRALKTANVGRLAA